MAGGSSHQRSIEKAAKARLAEQVTETVVKRLSGSAPSSVSPPWYESNLFWGLVALGAGILLTVVAAMKHDLRWLLWLAWPCFVFASWTVIKRVKRVWVRRIAAGACIVVVGAGLYGMGIWLRITEASTPDALFQAQLNELEQLEDFVGTKDESELREVFGLSKLLSVNLWIWRSAFAPNRYSSEELNAINAYIKSNIKQADTRFGVTSKEGSRLTFTANKGAVAVISLPQEYVTGRATLARFESSIKLPSTVRSALLELDQTITNNTSLLFDVMNEKVSQNPDNLIFDNDPHSRFFSSMTNTYWEKFTPLRPKTEKVVESTRIYLKVDQR
jgi:hypothetical protein